MSKDILYRIGLGGGCHWCTEAVFQSLIGVNHVDQGWIASTGNAQRYAEAVIVNFDPNLITLSILIEIHLLTHASNVNHSMRDKYRSAVYYFSENQGSEVSNILEDHNIKFTNKLITKALPFDKFKANKESLLNYYKTRPNAPFCTTHIEPKIARLLKTHRQFIEQKNLPKHQFT